MHKRKIFALLFVFITIFMFCPTVQATKIYGFQPVDMTDEKIEQIWRNINVTPIKTPETLDDLKTSIVSFDVSENGNILLGFTDKRIAVIDETGKVVCFFKFRDEGAFYVQWNGENILLLMVRGSIIVEFTLDGEMVNMINADEHNRDNVYLWNDLYDIMAMEVNGYTYRMTNDLGILNFFSPAYSLLIKTDAAGNETILYNAGKIGTNPFIVWLVLFGFLSIFIPIVWIVSAKKRKQQNQK